MYKKVIASLMVTMSVGATLLPMAASADELGSDVEVKVTGGSGEGPTEEDISDKEPRNGDFVIKAVSDFKYPAVPIGETRAATIGTDKALGIEVVDETGDGTGWNVKVSMASFKVQDGPNAGENLKGWELSIPTAQITSKNASLDAANAPVGKKAVISEGISSVVFQADEGKGMGRYTNIFERHAAGQEDTRTTGVQLSIPNTARKANYIGKLKWTLANTPNSN